MLHLKTFWELFHLGPLKPAYSLLPLTGTNIGSSAIALQVPLTCSPGLLLSKVQLGGLDASSVCCVYPPVSTLLFSPSSEI